MTNKEYRAHEGISKSSLWEINKSPLHFRYKMDNPQTDTAALLFGRAVHKFVLEESDFFNEFAIIGTFSLSSNDGCDKAIKLYSDLLKRDYTLDLSLPFREKQQLCYKLSDDVDLDFITQSDFDEIKAISDSIKTVPDAWELLQGEVEQSYFWTDDLTGEKCKCRPDVINHEKKLIVDLKTTDSCENNHFERSAKKYGYKLQAGMYREGVFQNTFEEYGFKFVAVEKKPPYAVRIYNCTPEYIDQGYDKFRELIGIYHDCKAKNEWLGYDRIGAREVDLLADDYVE